MPSPVAFFHNTINLGGALFRPVKNNTGGTVEGAVTADGIYKMVKHYAKRGG